MKVYCPNCGASEEVAASRPGSSANCRSCGASFLVRVRLDADTSRSVAPLYMWFVRKGDGSLISFPGAEQLYRSVLSGLVDMADELSADGRTWAPVTSMPVLARLIEQRPAASTNAPMPSEVRRALAPDRFIGQEDDEPTRNETVSWGPLAEPRIEPQPASQLENDAAPLPGDNTRTAPYPTLPRGMATTPSAVHSMLEQLQQKSDVGAKEALSDTVQAAILRSQGDSLKGWDTPTRPEIPVTAVPPVTPPPAAMRPPMPPPAPPLQAVASAPLQTPPHEAPAKPKQTVQELEDLSPLVGTDLGDGEWDRIEPSSPGGQETRDRDIDVWGHEAAIRRRNRLLGTLAGLALVLLALVLFRLIHGGGDNGPAVPDGSTQQEQPDGPAEQEATPQRGATKGPLTEEGSGGPAQPELTAPAQPEAAPKGATQEPSRPNQPDPAVSAPDQSGRSKETPLAKVEPTTPKPAAAANPEFRPLRIAVDTPAPVPTPPSAVAALPAPLTPTKIIVAEAPVEHTAPKALDELAPNRAQTPPAQRLAVVPPKEKRKPTQQSAAPEVRQPSTVEKPAPKAVEKSAPAATAEPGTGSADRMREAGRYAEAAELYEQQLKSGGSAALHLKLADCYRKMDNCAKALPHFEKAIALGKSKAAYVGAARCHNALGDPDKAAALLRDGLRQYDDKVMRTLLKQYGGE